MEIHHSDSAISASRAEQKQLLRKAIKKLCLRLFILFIFSALGGFIFRWSEGVKELEYKCGVKKVHRDFIDTLWHGSTFMKEDDWKSVARRRLLKFEDELHSAFDAGINSYSGQKTWSFLNSVFYSLTIMTTIGYGHITPVTILGKIFTMLYALIGIPIFTIILTDAGKVFTRGLKLYLTRKNEKLLRINEDFDLPLLTAFGILFMYTALGMTFFYCLESEWSLLDSFYFIFISASTVGLGDFVPSSPLIAILSSLYFLFGLALTAGVLGLVQERMDNVLNTVTTKVGGVVGISNEDTRLGSSDERNNEIVKHEKMS